MNLEKCFAPICTYVATGLCVTAQAMFQEACCDVCNECLYAARTRTATQEAAGLVGIDRPDYGNNCVVEVPSR